jgi:hypothetical protein
MSVVGDVVIGDDGALRGTIGLIRTVKFQMHEERVLVRQIASGTRLCVRGFVM